MLNKVYKLAVLISGEGSNLQMIIDSISANALDAQVVLVISNQADANGLNRVKKADIPSQIVSTKKGETRTQYDQRLIKALAPYSPDLIVLAGFMRILSPIFIQQYAGKIINIHPSLLPAYMGLDTHQRVLDANEQYHGATVHFVTETLDAGELIVQSRIEIQPGDSAETLQQRIHTEEHIIYPRAIQWLAQGAN
jgi:phosphoribosylglycinamide formyltransferase-1